jgi:hypothetical protein
MRNYFHRYSKFALGIFVLIAALSLIHWIGDSGYIRPSGLEAKVVVEPNVLDEEMPVLDRTHAAVRAVMEVQELHTDALMAEPGILGTGTGLTEDGRLAIFVLAESFELARAAVVPATIEGVPIRVKITGKIKALKPPAGKGPKNREEIDPTARFERPVPIGVSTGHPNITAGTIGCRVTDGTNVYALSNNHVYADENRADIGDNVLQPGAYDEGVYPDDAIGTLNDFEAIVFSTSPNTNNTIDAAIALSSTDLLGNATPSDGYGTPKSTTAEASLGLRVMKYGRTTGLTKGRIYAFNATVNVAYDSGVARFVNQIVITPGSFSAGGDSGSLVVVQRGDDKRKPVGLVFAGSPSITVANPIDPVLNSFAVTIDGE